MSNIVSIKSFLSRNDEGAEYRRIIGLLLEGIALHAVEADRDDYDSFGMTIRDIEARLAKETSVSALFQVAGEVVKLLGEHNRHASAFFKKQGIELQQMVAMLTRAVMDIGASSEQSQVMLAEIETQIENARKVDNIQLLKTQLGECLVTVRREVSRQKTEESDTLRALRRQLGSSHASAEEGFVERDPVTGLPNSAEAEKAIRTCLSSPDNKYLAVAAVGRIQAINARFGYLVGDKILNVFKSSFEKTISGQDRLFRWRGPALVALLERNQTIEQVRSEIRRFADTKLEETLEVGTRSIMMPISATWTVIPVAPPSDGLMRKIEAFLSAQVPREYS
jgi:GGDEF domain-containing protein